MAYFENNNDFFGYSGVINRKNYSINIFILFAIYIALSFLNLSAFSQYTTFKFLFSILDFVISLIKFVIIFAILSLVYRRFADIAKSKSLAFSQNIKRFFVIFYVFPILYITCLRFFIYNIPFIYNSLDFLFFFIFLPICFLISLLICFIK